MESTVYGTKMLDANGSTMNPVRLKGAAYVDIQNQAKVQQVHAWLKHFHGELLLLHISDLALVLSTTTAFRKESPEAIAANLHWLAEPQAVDASEWRSFANSMRSQRSVPYASEASGVNEPVETAADLEQLDNDAQLSGAQAEGAAADADTAAGLAAATRARGDDPTACADSDSEMVDADAQNDTAATASAAAAMALVDSMAALCSAERQISAQPQRPGRAKRSRAAASGADAAEPDATEEDQEQAQNAGEQQHVLCTTALRQRTAMTRRCW